MGDRRRETTLCSLATRSPRCSPTPISSSALARLEVTIALGALFRRFPTWRWPVPPDPDTARSRLASGHIHPSRQLQAARSAHLTVTAGQQGGWHSDG